MTAVPPPPSEPMPSHPEEMKSVFDLRIGKWITVQASARMTPAGVITLGIAGALVTAAACYFCRCRRL